MFQYGTNIIQEIGSITKSSDIKRSSYNAAFYTTYIKYTTYIYYICRFDVYLSMSIYYFYTQQ